MGMIAMALLFPVPGYVASKIQNVQTEKMKKVGAHGVVSPRRAIADLS